MSRPPKGRFKFNGMITIDQKFKKPWPDDRPPTAQEVRSIIKDGGEGLTDEEVLKIQDLCHRFANILFDHWLEQRNKEIRQNLN